MRYFVVMEVEPDSKSNGFIPIESPKGDTWIAGGHVVSEKKLIDKLEKVRMADDIDLNEFCK